MFFSACVSAARTDRQQNRKWHKQQNRQGGAGGQRHVRIEVQREHDARALTGGALAADTLPSDSQKEHNVAEGQHAAQTGHGDGLINKKQKGTEVGKQLQAGFGEGKASGQRAGLQQLGNGAGKGKRAHHEVDVATARKASFAPLSLPKPGGGGGGGGGGSGHKKRKGDAQGEGGQGGSKKQRVEQQPQPKTPQVGSDGQPLSKAHKKNLKRAMKRAEARQGGAEAAKS
jgi:hypothetical protein